MIGNLPERLTVGGRDYAIRSDYRNVLHVFEAFSDPELRKEEKWIVAIYLLFKDFTCADDVLRAAGNGFDLEEAMRKVSWFIAAGSTEKEITELPVYSWQKDEQMIFSAVNKVAGKETRSPKYLHWWTFLGYFNEVGEGPLTFLVGIRRKLNKKKKLEKHENEFLNQNRSLVELEKEKSWEEREQKEAYKAFWKGLL